MQRIWCVVASFVTVRSLPIVTSLGRPIVTASPATATVVSFAPLLRVRTRATLDPCWSTRWSMRVNRMSPYAHLPPSVGDDGTAAAAARRTRRSTTARASRGARQQLVGNLSTPCRQLVNTLSATYQQLVGNLSTPFRQLVNTLSATCQYLIGNFSATCQQLISKLSATCQQVISKLSASCPAAGTTSAPGSPWTCSPCSRSTTSRLAS